MYVYCVLCSLPSKISGHSVAVLRSSLFLRAQAYYINTHAAVRAAYHRPWEWSQILQSANSLRVIMTLLPTIHPRWRRQVNQACLYYLTMWSMIMTSSTADSSAGHCTTASIVTQVWMDGRRRSVTRWVALAGSALKCDVCSDSSSMLSGINGLLPPSSGGNL